VDHVNSCLATLYRLDDELKKIEYPKDQKIRTGLRKMAWPFKSGETKELREELQKHREVLTLALSADTTTALLKCLSVQGTMASDIHDIRMTLQKNEEIKTRIAMNDKRQHVLRYFLVTDPRENYKTSLSLRHPSTGFWLTEGETFRSWLRDEGSKIWLSGIPGAGKTVLSGLIIEQCIARSTADRAVAYYYCDYKNAKSQVTVNILSSLAAQLAIQHEGSFSLLEKYHESLHPPHQLENRPEIKELVVLLQNMAHSFEDVRLIIDGLDECGENTEEASEWLKALACEGQVSISLAVLSRDEPRIRDFLGPPICTHIEVAAQTKEIEHFVRTTIEEKSSKRRFRIKSPELKDEIIRTLVSKAQGM
jgi:Cdc6-like AAA superfamily ATPase